MTTMESYAALFERSVEAVLEAMFFESLSEEPRAARGLPEGCLVAAVSFEGTRSGRMMVAMEKSTAATLAGNFLGLDEDESAALEENTLKELTNICCGAFLSRLDPQGSFRIGAPEVVAEAPEDRDWLVLRVECGAISFLLEW